MNKFFFCSFSLINQIDLFYLLKRILIFCDFIKILPQDIWRIDSSAGLSVERQNHINTHWRLVRKKNQLLTRPIGIRMF